MHVRLPGVGSNEMDGMLNDKGRGNNHKCMSAAFCWFLLSPSDFTSWEVINQTKTRAASETRYGMAENKAKAKVTNAIRLPVVVADMLDGLLNSKDRGKSHRCMSAAVVWFLVVT